MNQDESDLSAHASYLVGMHESTFSTPIYPPYVSALYHLSALAFGPYEMLPLRVYALLASLGMSVLIYALVARQTSRWCGLLSGLVFLYYNLYFEGLSVNRESFAGPVILVGLQLYLCSVPAPPRRAWWLVFATGLILGIACCLKEQAVLLLLPVAADLIYRMLEQRQARGLLAQGAAYAGGVATAAVLYTIPFLAAGTLREHLMFLLGHELSYAAAVSPNVDQDLTATILVYFREMYQRLPFRRIWLFAYMAAILTTGRMVVGALFPSLVPRGSRVSPTVRVFAWSLLFAGIAVSLGRRFFLHYFQLMLPSIAVLFGCTVDWFARAKRFDWRSIAASVTMVLLFVADVLWLPSPYPLESLAPSAAVTVFRPEVSTLVRTLLVIALAGACFLAILALVLRAARRASAPSALARMTAVVVCLLFVVESGKLAIETTVLPMIGVSRALASVPPPELLEWLKGVAHKDDLLVVWGRFPEIYSYTKLQSGTRFPAFEIEGSVEVLPVLPPRIDQVTRDMFLEDLEIRRPRFVVDASLWAINSAVFRLVYHPQVAEFLDAHYTLAKSVGACDVYLWQDNPALRNPRPAGQAALDHALLQARLAASREPRAVALWLAQGDLFRDQDRPDEAVSAYQRALQILPGWRFAEEPLRAVQAGRHSRIPQGGPKDREGLGAATPGPPPQENRLSGFEESSGPSAAR